VSFYLENTSAIGIFCIKGVSNFEVINPNTHNVTRIVKKLLLLDNKRATIYKAIREINKAIESNKKGIIV
jgi:hypothetical protein